MGLFLTIISNTAVINFTKAIGLNPCCLEAYSFRGSVFIEQEKYIEAIEDFSKQIELEPKNHIAYLNRGIANEALKRLPESMADYTKAMDLSPRGYVFINFLRKGLYHSFNKIAKCKNKDPDKVKPQNDNVQIECYLSGLLHPIDKMSFIERGKLFETQNKFHEATLDYTMAIELDPNSKNCYKLRGNLYFTQQKYLEAISDYNKVIELSLNKESKDHNLRGKIFEKNQKIQEAIKDYSAAIELNPYDPEYYMNRAALLKSTGKIAEAEDDLTKAGLLKTPASKNL
ncbi:tetratricopeptide repeat protein [bacterium]|nr:tetratricopeptide repeat protein [bacterium]